MNLVEQPEKISQHCLVSNVSLKEAKNGNKYVELTLSDKTASIPNCKIWNVTESVWQELQKSSVLFVNGVADHYGGNYKINIQDFNFPGDDFDISSLIPTEPIDVEGTYKDILELVYSMTNPILKKATLGLLGEFGDSLKTVSAAKRMHHYKRSGLLRHVKEMLDLALFVQNIYPTANKDLLIAGIIYHDIMKVEEYQYSNGLAEDFSKKGFLFGHIFLGAELPKKYVSDEEAASEEIEMLQHIILSHHGKLEWGSPVEPVTIEAVIVHHVDNLDAKVYAFSDELSQMEVGEKRQSHAIHSKVYKSPLNVPQESVVVSELVDVEDIEDKFPF